MDPNDIKLIAQAWSVAELLCATIEGVYGIRPMSRMQAEAPQAGDKARTSRPGRRRALTNE